MHLAPPSLYENFSRTKVGKRQSTKFLRVRKFLRLQYLAILVKYILAKKKKCVALITKRTATKSFSVIALAKINCCSAFNMQQNKTPIAPTCINESIPAKMRIAAKAKYCNKQQTSNHVRYTDKQTLAQKNAPDEAAAALTKVYKLKDKCEINKHTTVS